MVLTTVNDVMKKSNELTPDLKKCDRSPAAPIRTTISRMKKS